VRFLPAKAGTPTKTKSNSPCVSAETGTPTKTQPNSCLLDASLSRAGRFHFNRKLPFGRRRLSAAKLRAIEIDFFSAFGRFRG
jgi:hypothetical protein